MESNELLRLLESVQDTPVSHVDLSANAKRIKVDMDTRKITGHKEFGVIKDHLAENIIFEVKRYKGDTDLAEKNCAIHWENGENGGVLPVTEVDVSEDGHILMRWELSDEFTQFAGDIVYALHFFSILDGGFTYHAATYAEHGKLGTTLNASAHSRNKITPSEIEVYIAKMNALSAEIDQKLANLEISDEQAQQAVSAYLEKNPVKDGENGATFTPSVSEDGALSWSNDKGLANPADVNIKGPKGDTGEQGQQGVQGPAGSDANVTPENISNALGYTPADSKVVSQLSSEKVNKTGITLDKDVDGLIYIFIDGKPVGNGVEVTGEIVDGDVIGTLDENNNLLLSGDIADGTYTLKWLKKDGTYADAGNLIVSSITKYAINTTLSNCSASGATSINGGGSATVTITASSGYELPDTITVSGAEYTWDKATGNIILSNPTSDVYITVTAVKSITNFIEYNATNTTDWSIWCNDARVGSDGTYRSSTAQNVTNYIPVQNGDIVHFRNVMLNGQYCVLYNANKTIRIANTLANMATNGYITDLSTLNALTYEGQFTIASDIAYIRFTCNYDGYASLAEDGVVINIERNGEYL